MMCQTFSLKTDMQRFIAVILKPTKVVSEKFEPKRKQRSVGEISVDVVGWRPITIVVSISWVHWWNRDHNHQRAFVYLSCVRYHRYKWWLFLTACIITVSSCWRDENIYFDQLRVNAILLESSKLTQITQVYGDGYLQTMHYFGMKIVKFLLNIMIGVIFYDASSLV